MTLYLDFDNLFDDNKIFQELKRLNILNFYYFNIFQKYERINFESKIKNGWFIESCKGSKVKDCVDEENYFEYFVYKIMYK